MCPLTHPPTAVPVLLPYKPRGSEELFYVPQTEADVSSTSPSDTTMESSHTGTSNFYLAGVLEFHGIETRTTNQHPTFLSACRPFVA